MVTTHRNKFTGRQMIERQVNRAAPAVARPGGHVTLLEHRWPVNVRIVPQFRPAVLWLLRPAQKAIYCALRAVTVPQKQTEANGRSLSSRFLQGSTQGPRADNSVYQVPVHRLAGEIIPGSILRIPANPGHELINK